MAVGPTGQRGPRVSQLPALLKFLCRPKYLFSMSGLNTAVEKNVWGQFNFSTESLVYSAAWEEVVSKVWWNVVANHCLQVTCTSMEFKA